MNQPFSQNREDADKKDEKVVNSIHKGGRDSYDYDVALSFAGEDRETARKLAGLLQKKGMAVFYDENERGKLLGKDLYQHLQKIYRDSARFCIILSSQFYAKNQWTRHELRQAQARAFQEEGEYILPIKLDNTVLPGLSETVSYLDIREMTIEEIIFAILQKF